MTGKLSKPSGQTTSHACNRVEVPTGGAERCRAARKGIDGLLPGVENWSSEVRVSDGTLNPNPEGSLHCCLLLGDGDINNRGEGDEGFNTPVCRVWGQSTLMQEVRTTRQRAGAPQRIHHRRVWLSINRCASSDRYSLECGTRRKDHLLRSAVTRGTRYEPTGKHPDHEGHIVLRVGGGEQIGGSADHRQYAGCQGVACIGIKSRRVQRGRLLAEFRETRQTLRRDDS